MSDIPFRVYGPQPLDGGNGLTLYTAPSGTSKFFIRDITFTNIAAATSYRVRCSIGSISDATKRVIDQTIAVGTPTFIRPLWLMDDGETLQALQIIGDAPTLASVSTLSSATDASSYALAAWTPAANTMYLLVQTNGVASGTTALNPNSITGNGTWTLINQATSTVAATTNVGISAWYWYSSAAGANATTTVGFSGTQHSFNGIIVSVANAHQGNVAVSPWTSSATPIVQSGNAADSTAPASTTDSKTVTLASTVQTGLVFYACSRAGTSGGTSAPTGMTETGDFSTVDASGSVCALQGDLNYTTTPPYTTSPVGPATHVASTTGSRAAVAFEMVPAGWVNCMVSGIEVR